MEVEVVFPDICNAYYKATFRDINVAEGKCLVTFDDGWKPNEWVDLQNVRYPTSQSNAQLNPSPGTQVEAFLPLKEGEPAGWWLASINKSKGEIAGIQFQMTSDSIYSDLVEHKYLRAPNKNPSFSNLKFFSKEFEVPSTRDIHDFCCDPRVHFNFQSKIQALSVTYDPDKQSLVVLADNQRCIERAELLIDMHLSDLSTQATLRIRTDKVAQRLQTSSIEDRPEPPQDNGIHEEKVYIPQELVGLAMGRQGWNVNEAREIPGIISIDFDDFTSMFTIKAETKEASAKARELIEFMQEIQYIPRDVAGKVIGKQGKIVQQILEKSRLNNIKVIGDQEAKDRKLDTRDVPFEFVGRRTAIENAKMMLEYHLDHLREVSSILKDQEEITQKLRDSGIEEPPTFYPRPNPPRGRGRGRGRQTGGGGGSPRKNRPGGQRGGGGGRQNDGDNDDREDYEQNADNGGENNHNTDESESSDEEQRQEEAMKRADSPVDGDVPQDGTQTDRRRKKNNKRYRNRRRGGGRGGRAPRDPPTTTNNNNVDDDWPPVDENQPQQEEEEEGQQQEPADDQTTAT